MKCELPPPNHENPDLLIIAGEHSGDEHGKYLLEELKNVLANRPLNLCALGGEALAQANAQILFPLVDHSVVGFVDVLKNYFFFKQIFEATVAWIKLYQPRAICLVDYPGFNLRLAKRLCEECISQKGGGNIPVYYYVSPQIWAWKAKRRFKMEKWLDALGVIFPFEKEWYKDTALPVAFVGHPFLAKNYANPICYDPKGPVLLLPGSRKSAVKRIFPVLLETIQIFLKKYPFEKVTVVYPSEEIKQLFMKILSTKPQLKEHVTCVPSGFPVPCKAVIGSSGTMSLKCALAGVPGIITYKANPITYKIGRLLVKLDRLGMVNILLNEFVYPEFIQEQAQAYVLAEELEKCTQDKERRSFAVEAKARLEVLLCQTEAYMPPGAWLASSVGSLP